MIAAVPLLLGLHLRAVVDQIDDGWASVEWQRSGEFGFVPVELLPEGTAEGDRICVRVRRSRRSPPPFELPQVVAARGWRASVVADPPRSTRRHP